jgi:hypothetical protein
MDHDRNDIRSHECQVLDVSANGAKIVADIEAPIGSTFRLSVEEVRSRVAQGTRDRRQVRADQRTSDHQLAHQPRRFFLLAALLGSNRKEA